MATTYFAIYPSATTPTWTRGSGSFDGWSGTPTAYGQDTTPPTTTTVNDEPTITWTGTLSAGTAYKIWAIWDDGATSSNSGNPEPSAEFTTKVVHANTGALSAQSATLAGISVRFRAHPSTGALTAQSATVAGTSVRFRAHPSTGALSAQSATVAGSAAHKTLHATSGAISAQAATVAGTADHTTPAGTHGTTGALSAQAATVSGSAAHKTLHATSGALSGQAASVAGTAVHRTLHTSTGALSAQSATLSGTAVHSFAVTHDTTGALSAGSASVSGSAQLNGVFTDATQRGVPGRPRRPPWSVTINGKRFYGTQEEIEQLIREFAEEQAEKQKPKRAKIVVKPGISKPEIEKRPEVVEQAQEIQQDMREVYARVYQAALQKVAQEAIRLEMEEEEDLLGIL